MKKILCFYYDNFADFEITLACHKFRQVGGREIVGVGYSLSPVLSESGLRFVPDINVQDALQLTDIEALLIPGGPIQAPGPGILELIAHVYGQQCLIAAICNGPHYLARAGLLERHRYTTSCTPAAVRQQGIADPFPRRNLVDERVVVDANVVTAKGRAFVDFSMALFERLGIYADSRDMRQLWDDIRG